MNMSFSTAFIVSHDYGYAVQSFLLNYSKTSIFFFVALQLPWDQQLLPPSLPVPNTLANCLILDLKQQSQLPKQTSETELEQISPPLHPLRFFVTMQSYLAARADHPLYLEENTVEA